MGKNTSYYVRVAAMKTVDWRSYNSFLTFLIFHLIMLTSSLLMSSGSIQRNDHVLLTG